MRSYLALLRLQLLTRFADFKPKNLKNALRDKRGRTIGMAFAILFLVAYLGVILYIIETKALDVLTPTPEAPGIDLRNMLVILAVMLSTGGTLIMAFFFIMSSLYLGRDTAFLASMPLKSRTILSAKLTQVWLSETLIDAIIILPACILYGTRVGEGADFYIRMVLVWLTVAILPICIAAAFSAFLVRLSTLWKHREAILTVGGILLFVAYFILMMNVGTITGDSAEGGDILRQFFMDNSARISGMTKIFPPADWAAEGLLGNWGMLGLFILVSVLAAVLLIAVLGIFYRKLSLLQAETPQASGKKGVRRGDLRATSAFLANVKREFKLILRVPSYATNILPIVFMPMLFTVMLGMVLGRNAGENGGSASSLLGNLSPALVMGIMTAIMSYMSGMNPALCTAVTREGRGHDFIKALPVSGKTIIHAKLAVGMGLEAIGIVAAGIAMMVVIPGFATETVMAVVLCLVFSFGCGCLALDRDVRKPKLDWVTEQEAVKQNFGVLISMLVSWGILIALAGVGFLMINAGWELIPVFAVLLVLVCAIAFAAYRLLMKNTEKYYCAG